MATTALKQGDVLAGKYRIDGVLGQGGMGLVFGAFHLELDQPVAVKVLHPEVAERGDAAARFRREARAAAKIKSEHVVRVLDVGTLDGGSAYMVMEYLEGNDLAEEMHRRGQLPVSETLDYVLQTCEAVAEAHMVGIVHRDLKPANLFLSHRPDGSRVAKVLDFGISKSVVPGSSSDPSLTGTSTIMGSPLYMSPEQMRSARDVDARTDVWSIGTILFEAIAGYPPFAGDSVPQICAALLHDPPPPFQNFRPDVPPGLEIVIVRCLAKDRENRWSSIGELANALAPYAPAGARLHAARANRSKTTGDAAASPEVSHAATVAQPPGAASPGAASPSAASAAAPPAHPATDTLDPPGTAAPPASPTLASSPSAPQSAATLNSWGTTGSGKRPASRLLWLALGGALLLGGIGAVLMLKRSEDQVAIPVEVLSAPAVTSTAPTPLTEIAPSPTPSPIPTLEAQPAGRASAEPPQGKPSASATPLAVHPTTPVKPAASKRDAANRPPSTKVETISDFGGRR